MFFLITQSEKVTGLFLAATKGRKLIVTTVNDVVDDIIYGQYLLTHTVTCIEVMDGARLSHMFLKKLAAHSRVVVYSRTYNPDLFIYYWELGVIYIAHEVSPSELTKLFSVQIPEDVQTKLRNIEVNTANGWVRIGETSILLTVTEVRLFSALLSAGGSYLSRPQLLDAIEQNVDHDERLIDGHLKRVRQKLKKFGLSPDLIVTGYGFGYRLDLTKVNEAPKASSPELLRERRGP